jgi:peptidoglycan/LPS O-acetylase OafA/YrhL
MRDKDSVISAFLSFLGKDIESRADKLSAFPPELARTVADLTSQVASDPDGPIDENAAFRPPRHFDYIDALRGYAILMVIAVHTSQAFPDLPDALAKILNQGARGVQLFFVTSALTLSMSWVARNEDAADFYTRRIFRIAPMFWIAIIFFLWLGGGPSIYAPDGIGVRQVLMTALLVHGLWPDTITSVVPGGWSVADEVIFYVLFPAMVPPLLKASWKSVIIAALATLVLVPRLSGLLEGFSYLLPSFAEGVAGIYFSLWFPRQLPCFIFGIALFKFSTERRPISVSAAKYVCIVAIALMLIIPFLEGVKYALPLGLATSYGIAFSLLALSLMYWPTSPLISAPVVWIGKISYSAYFVHFATLYYLPALRPIGSPIVDVAFSYGVVVVITAGISSLTYLTIEKPMIRLGSALIATRRSASRLEQGIIS